MASPVANITWNKDGKIVSPLQNLQKADSGKYVITAVNKHGSKQHILTLDIQCKLFSLYHSTATDWLEIV